MENYSVYIIQSLKDNSYYIGYSSNVAH